MNEWTPHLDTLDLMVMGPFDGMKYIRSTYLGRYPLYASVFVY